MTIDNKLLTAINEQVNAEFQAALIYQQLSYEMDALSLPGLCDWFASHAVEEQSHAAKFAQHLLDRSEKVALHTIEVPSLTINSALDAFKAAYDHEKKVSAMIRDLALIADEVKDLDSRSLINFFLDEQIEEEATVSEIVDQLELVGSDGSGILRIDARLGGESTSEEA
ncbi:ferritin [Corynebacterium glucuronolyticum]|nr:ferritin [Corynebacterium sp. HMSC073D01]WKD64168.1 Ferritin [Corynebacterium glucuronolyticum DSM 44120]SMB84761.1 ferritin [Corynebacterium glucuronolyticum]